MEHEIARRRMSRILDHVAKPDEVLPPSPHLFPMSCSSALSTMVPRCDNRLFFSRQGSASQAYFMQQVSANQQNSSQCKREPMFSKRAQTQSSLLTSREDYLVKQDLAPSSNDGPKYARQNCGKTEKQPLLCSRTRQTSISNVKKFDAGMEWTPRMDVAESGPNYVVTVELPGVSITDVRVEVDGQNLTILGKRSTHQWRMANCAGKSSPVYHQREILQGPYRVIWPIPNDVNKDNVSAEFVLIGSAGELEALQQAHLLLHKVEKKDLSFMIFSIAERDGFLQITLPRL